MDNLSSRASPPRRLIDRDQVGQKLGCSGSTVSRLADSGKIPPGIKLNSLRRWDEAELDEFIRSGCRPPKAKGVQS
jgi:predicted DNA-binding transcriptional regulator AlpA